MVGRGEGDGQLEGVDVVPLLGAVDVVPLLGAMAGCHYNVLWWVPLQGPL